MRRIRNETHGKCSQRFGHVAISDLVPDLSVWAGVFDFLEERALPGCWKCIRRLKQALQASIMRKRREWRYLVLREFQQYRHAATP